MSTAGNWNNARGFTLVETALAVLLIALFSALSIPLMGRLGDGALDGAARRLAGTVKYLYNESALSGRPYRLTFDLEEDVYRAARLEVDGTLTDEGTGPARQQRLKSGVRFRNLSIAGRGTFSSGEITADILPVGYMEETTIRLGDDRNRILTLRINPFTGTTEIHEGDREF